MGPARRLAPRRRPPLSGAGARRYAGPVTDTTGAAAGDPTAARPTIDELDALSTDELKDRAFALARRRGDVRFLWDLVKHLPPSGDFTQEDGATTGLAMTFNDVLALVEQVFGRQLGNIGDLEPLIRARLLDYLISDGDRA